MSNAIHSPIFNHPEMSCNDTVKVCLFFKNLMHAHKINSRFVSALNKHKVT